VQSRSILPIDFGLNKWWNYGDNDPTTSLDAAIHQTVERVI